MFGCFEMDRLEAVKVLEEVAVVRFGMKCEPLAALMADTLERPIRVVPIML